MKTKLLFTLLMTSVLSFGQVLSTLPLYEGFDYTADYTEGEPINTLLNSDTMTGQGPWIEDNYGSTKNPFIITSPISSYSGLPAFSGNAIEVKGGTNDPLLYFNPVNETDGVDLYASCMIKVTDMSAVSGSLDYFFALSTSGFGYGAALYFSKVDATTYNLGINESNTSGEAIVHTGTTFTENVDEIFVVIKYEFNSAGNSVAHLFINPTISGVTEPSSTVNTSSIALLDEANRAEFTLLKINANSNSRTPGIAIDEVRIATSWSDVISTTSSPTLGLDLDEVSNFDVYPNPATDFITIKSSKMKISSVGVYSILGKVVKLENILVDNKLDVSSLSKGVYCIKIIGEDNSSVTKRIVIE